MARVFSTSAIYDTDGSAILLPLRTSIGNADLVFLEPVAGRIWRLLENGDRLDDAITAVAAHYGVAFDRVRTDIQPVLETLRAKGIWREDN